MSDKPVTGKDLLEQAEIYVKAANMPWFDPETGLSGSFDAEAREQAAQKFEELLMRFVIQNQP